MNTVELILDNQHKVDLSTETSISLTYQLSDVREFDKRKSDFTLPFTLPGTKNNNEIFGWIYELDSDTLYNPNLRVPVLILLSGVRLLSGYLQLNKINIDDYGNLVSYEVTAFSDVADFISEINDKRLCDLDLSKWNHLYTSENVSGSWEAFIVENGAKYPFEKGRGYVYPYINWETKYGAVKKESSEIILNCEAFFPTLYLRSVLEEIIRSAGFSYVSNFIQSELFSSLVITPDISQLYYDPDELVNVRAKAITTTYSYTRAQGDFENDPYEFTKPAIFDKTSDDPDNPDYYDLGNNFSYGPTLGDYYTSPIKQHADISVSVSFFTTYGYFYIGIGPGDVCGDLITNIHEGDQSYTATLWKKSTDPFTPDAILDQVTGNLPINYTQVINCMPVRINSLNLSANNVQLQAGEILYVTLTLKAKVISSNIFGQTFPTIIRWAQSSGSFRVQPVSTTIEEGSPIDFNKLLNCEIKQLDLFSSVLRMFNLYVYNDPVVTTRLIIEPRKDFYDNNSVVDWNDKLDRSVNGELIPIPELSGNSFLFSYREDSDYYNDIYSDDVNEVYGQRVVQTGNEFALNEVSLDLIFSPTPLSREFGTDRVISEIFIDRNGTRGVYEAPNTRILYYGGMLDTSNEWTLYSNGKTYSTYDKYPYAGHTDITTDSGIKIDLLFDDPVYYFYDRFSSSFNNLYNIYWRDYIEEIYNKNSKMFIGEFYLTEYDIQTLNLRNFVYLDGVYWYINKIDGFTPNQKTTTKVELLRVINNYNVYNVGNAPITKTQPLWPEINYNGLVNNLPIRSKQNIMYNNLVKFVHNISGGNSLVNWGARNNMIVGDNLSVGSSVKNSLILGDSSGVFAAKNSLILGDSNLLGGDINNSIILLDNYLMATQSYASQSQLFSANNQIVYFDGEVKKIGFEEIRFSLDNYNVVKKITVTQSQIISASSSPVLLVDSPGTFSAIDLVSFAVGFNFGSASFATQSGTDTLYGNLIMSNSLLSSSFNIGFTQSGFEKVFVNPISIQNEGIFFRLQNDVISGTGSTIDFYLTYNILS